MSIVKIGRIGRGRKAVNELGSVSYEVPFYVRTNDATDDGNYILSQLGVTVGSNALPIIGQTYSYDGHLDANAQCSSISVDQLDEDRSSKSWSVMAKFGQIRESGGTTGNPLERVARYSWGFTQFTKVLERDLSPAMKPVVNSAGIAFDPPVEVDWSRPVLRISKSIAAAQFSYWAQKAVEYQDAVNSDTFLYWPPQTAKLSALAIGEVERWQDVLYHTLNLEITFNREGWRLYVANMSRMVRDPADPFGSLPVFLRENRGTGAIIVDPVFIQLDGMDYSPTPTYLEFQGYYELPFTPFITQLALSF